MKFLIRCFVLTVLTVSLLFGVTAGALSPIGDPGTPPPAATSPAASDQDLLGQFGPWGVIITTILTGTLMITRSINEGRKIDVTTYKERAADAESRSNEEIGKVHKKLEELENKLDDVIADRDEYRNTLEERKAQFTQQILDMEKRHQRELEDLHAALMIEIHVRHKLERLLVENGISIPDTPPPYTRSMKQEVTASDRRDAEANTDAMKTFREEGEKA